MQSTNFKNKVTLNTNCILSTSCISGSITVFLSLIFVSVMMLLLALLESVHTSVSKWQILSISHNCLESLFGNFDNELFKDYGILAINPIDVDIDKKLEEYATDNCTKKGYLFNLKEGINLIKCNFESVSTDAYLHLTDNDGELFSKQVHNYMKYMELPSLTMDIADICNNSPDEVYDFSDSEYYSKSADLSVLDNPPKEDENSRIDLSEDDANNMKDGIEETISTFLKDGLLKLTVPDYKSVSTVTIDKISLPSVTTEFTSTGYAVNEGYEKNLSKVNNERLVFTEYISNVFGCYTNSFPNTKFKYEIEYIINGGSNDDENLLGTISKLVFLRASFNSVHILSDSSKRTSVSSLASSCTAHPTTKGLVEFALISAWSIAEGIIDVRDLLSKKKVPIFKDSSNWTLSLENIPKLASNITSNNDGKTGFNYKYYLKILIAMQTELALRFRSLDLIQLDICNKYNDTFRIANCVCGLDATFTYNYDGFYTNSITDKLLNIGTYKNTESYSYQFE